MRPAARRRLLTEADRAEWTAYARHLKRLPGTEPLPEIPSPPPPALLASPAPALAAPQRRPSVPLAVGASPGGLDRSSWNRLRSGKLAPSRKLDLHGRTAQHAFIALVVFIQEAHADQVRCVEIVTGRGSGETGGVIRRELPLWLNLPALRPLVLAASHPHPNNPGAVRLLLRRAR